MIAELTVIGITLLLLLTLIIKRFVYFKPASTFLPPQDVYQDVFQGNIHGWYKQGSGNLVMLLCHGNAGNVSHCQVYLQQFYSMGHSVLAFDYSGYGLSKGVPSEEMLYNNAIQMYHYLLQKGYSKYQIVPVGISMGGTVASYIASHYDLPKLILIAPLPSISILAQHLFPKLRFLSLFFPEFNTISLLSKYKGQTLMVHSLQDEIIPYEATYKLQALCTQVVPINGSHNDTSHIPWNTIEIWLKT